MSGKKAGTVKIQVRSRSAQASPSCSPIHSPAQSTSRIFNDHAAGGFHQMHNYPTQAPQQFADNQGSDRIRSRQVIVPTTVNRTQSSPPRTDKPFHISSSADGPQVSYFAHHQFKIQNFRCMRVRNPTFSRGYFFGDRELSDINM